MPPTGDAKGIPSKKTAPDWRSYCLAPEKMLDGNRADLLVDAQAYTAMLDAIAHAERTILMDTYIFNNDRAGRIFSDALCQKSRDGVDVRLIVDGVGTMAVPGSFFARMRQAGIQVLVYHPIAPWRRGFNLFFRNHRKLLVVDGRVGFAGGVNVGEQWLDHEMGGHGWHDIHARVEGPSAAYLTRFSIATWRKHGRRELDEASYYPEIEPAGDTLVRVIGSRERKGRRSIRRTYLHAIRHARKYIYIANAYFVPDRRVRRALAHAAGRGVDVRVMVPAQGDIVPVQLAGQAVYGRLLRKGIRILLWKKDVLHAKTAVIDDVWSTVGSYNLDRRSLTMNLEVNFNIVDRDFAIDLRSCFQRDQVHCEELQQEQWRRRSWWQKLLERFFYRFRKFM